MIPRAGGREFLGALPWAESSLLIPDHHTSELLTFALVFALIGDVGIHERHRMQVQSAMNRAAQLQVRQATEFVRCRELMQLLKSCCFNCGRLRLTNGLRADYKRRLKLLLRGDLASAGVVGTAGKSGDLGDVGLDAIWGAEEDAEEELSMGNADENRQHGANGGPLTGNVLTEIRVRPPSLSHPPAARSRAPAYPHLQSVMCVWACTMYACCQAYECCPCHAREASQVLLHQPSGPAPATFWAHFPGWDPAVDWQE